MRVSGSSFSEGSQQNMVSGKITDKNTGELLVGVNIVVEGTTIGAISDISGKYTIQVPNRNAVLLFSFIGYTSEKVPVNGQSVIDINLVSDVRALEEVVVVGYGTQKKKDITGAISVVATDALKSIPTGSPVNSPSGLSFRGNNSQFRCSWWEN